MTKKESNNQINIGLLNEIQQYEFAVLETVLYLNTHPGDETVLELHNKFARRLRQLMDKYQKRYGPLVPTYPEANIPWSWIDEPWPWEINY